MSQRWFVFQDDQVQGPFTTAEMRQKAASGQVKKSTLVSAGDDTDWREAGEIPGLLSAAPPPIQAPPALPPLPSGASPHTPPAAAPTNGLIYAGIGAGIAAVVLTLVVAAALALRGRQAAPAADPLETALADAARRTDRESTLRESLASPGDGGPGNLLTDERPTPVESSPAEPLLTANSTTPPAANPPSASPAPQAAPAPSSEPMPADPDPTTATPIPSPSPAPAATPQLTAITRAVLQPKPLLPAVVPDRTEATDRDITSFNDRVAFENTASDAYGLYLRFVQSHTFTDEQRRRIDEQLEKWKARAEAGLARLGGDWVAPEKALAARQQARRLIEEAETLVASGRTNDAITRLEEASKTDPNSIRADYILGLLYSLPRVGPVGAVQAESYFRKVLKRSPDDPAALNSLAVSLIKQSKYAEALRYLERAAELAPEPTEIIQNAGRLAFLAANTRLRGSPSSVVRKYENLHNKLVEETRSPIYDKETGWLHIVPVFPSEEQWEPTSTQARGGVELDRRRHVGSGAGIVVAPDYVLTSRHVVESSRRWGGSLDLGIADEVRISLGGAAGDREWAGNVVAIADDSDLALLQVPGLQSGATPLRDVPIEQETALMILGFPARSQFGAGLQATRSTIHALADPNRPAAPEYIILNTELASDEDGGPLLDETGRLAGLLTIQLNTESKLKGAVPADLIRSFLAAHLPNWSSVSAEVATAVPAVDWSEVVRRGQTSVVRVKCYYDAGIPALVEAGNQSPLERKTYEDFTCPLCSGLSWVDCPQKGCAQGFVTSRGYRTTPIPGTNKTAQVPYSEKVVCQTCRGAGQLDCPGCQGGLDAALLRQELINQYNQWAQQQWGAPNALPGGQPLPGGNPLGIGQPGVNPLMPQQPGGVPNGSIMGPGVQPTAPGTGTAPNPGATNPGNAAGGSPPATQPTPNPRGSRK